MNQGDLTREMAEAGVGVGRLVRFDPRWPDGFNPTAQGFIRSFVAPLISLPFFVVVQAMFARAQGLDADVHPEFLWASGGSQLFAVVAYPLVMGLLAKPLGYGQGYASFVIVTNWALLFLNVALAGASALILFGEVGYNLFVVLNLVILGLTLFIVWRAARETLAGDIGPSLLAVVLWVAVFALASQVATWIAPGLTDAA